MTKNLSSLAILYFLSLPFSTAQKEEKIKTGWNLGALPSISYDADLGFQYGALANLYNYGDGSRYPKYDHSLYLEISRFTKGSGINRFFYDSDQLLSGIRSTFDLSYITDPKMDFFGFNGYETILFRSKIDLSGKLSGKNLNWLLGIAIYNFKTSAVDREKYDLPEAETLFEKYLKWGIIKDNEKDGGWVNYIKAGLSYDSRDNEPNPMKGVWTEAVIQFAPGFLGNGDFDHTKISLTHRQYVTILERNLSLAYRLTYQQSIGGGTVPYFAQPLIITSFLKRYASQGLGGAQTLRGILRNRVVGDGLFYGNIELRWKIVRFQLINQNFYLALNPFWDFGMITKVIDPGVNLNTLDYGANFSKADFFSDNKEKLHHSVGMGLKIAMNENFILSVDMGKALDEQDGNSGLYIGLNFLF